MKKVFYTTIIVFTLSFGFNMNQAFGQCTNFAAGPFTDLNTAFGGAPCDDGTGCPFFEFTGFEVFASETYAVSGFVEGGQYEFSICNGPSAGTWVPEFTIIAPSGAIDAFGLGDGDGCTISWTASESGTYILGISDEESCGGGSNTSTDNGFPALTCLSGTACPVCEPGNLATSGVLPICEEGGTFDFIIENGELPPGGSYGVVAQNFLGGSGGGEAGSDGEIALRLNGPEFIGVDATLNVGVAPLVGPWVMKGLVFDADNNICGVTPDSLIVGFGTESPQINGFTSNGVDELTISAIFGLEPYSYLWSDGQTTQTAVGLAPGIYSIIVTDLNGCQSMELQQAIGTTSTNSIAALQNHSITPNPNNGSFSVNLDFESSQSVEVEVLDFTGKVVEKLGRKLTAGTFDFNLKNTPNGMYFVRITAGDESLTERIVVNK